MDKDKNEKSIKIYRILVVLFGLVFVALVVATILYLRDADEKLAKRSQTVATVTDASVVNQEETTVEKWQEGDVHYNGGVYRYNNQIKTYLFMGIDRKGPVEEAEDSISGGQSDAMFLLVVDDAREQISVIAINRNTMTPVDVYFADGTYSGRYDFQICLQHAYGDGKRLSCERTVDTVSRLFHNIPISGYLAMNMDGINKMNDALGGVTVEVLEDLENPEAGIYLKKGETVTLQGEAAELYLRGRDTEVFNSAGARLQRQQQYLLSLFSTMKTAAQEDQSKAMNAYDAVEDYLVSSVDFASLVDQISGYRFDDSHMYSVEGETRMGEQFEEYYVDEDALYDLIIQVFYQEVSD